MQSGTANFNVEKVETGGLAIYITGGILKITAFELRSTGTHGIQFAGGTLTVVNARIVSDYTNALARAVYVTGGSGIPPLRLHRCILVTKSVAGFSISGVGGPRPVAFYGQVFATKGVDHPATITNSFNTSVIVDSINVV